MTVGFGEAAAFITAVSWAISSYVFGATGHKVGSSAVTLLRMPYQMLMLAGACLAVRVDTSLSQNALIALFLSGLTGQCLSDFMLYRSMVVIGPQVAILLMSLSSVFTAALGFLFLGEVLSFQVLAGIATAITGVCIVITARSGSTLLPGQEVPSGRVLAGGLLMAFFSSLFMSVSYIFLKTAIQDGASPLWAAFVRLVIAAVLLWGMGLFRGWTAAALRVLVTKPAVFWIMLATSVVSAGGTWCASLAMDLAPVGVAATIIGTQPVISTFIGAIWQRRRPSGRVLFGTAVAFAGTALVCLR